MQFFEVFSVVYFIYLFFLWAENLLALILSEDFNL